MYTRSYYTDGEKMNLPEGYDGTAFSDSERISENYKEEDECPAEKTETAHSTGIFDGLGIGKLLGNGTLFGGLKIGTEEIIILALAAFMLFSGSRDIECAVMLFVLLFIK